MRRLLTLVMVVSAAASAFAEDIRSGAQRIVEVAENVYAVEPVFAGANGAFIVTDDSVIVVDTHGSPASAAALIDDIARITDQPVRYVVNTHWHVDHHAGNEAYYQAFGDDVRFVAHHSTRTDIPTLGRQQYRDTANFRTMPLDEANAALSSGSNSHGAPLTDVERAQVERFRDDQQAFIDAGDDFEFVLPDLTLGDSLIIHAAPSPVHIRFLGRAHTGGDVVVYIPDQRVVILGDVLTQPILWTWSGFPAEYVDTLRAIEALDFDHAIIGHGGPVLQGKDYLRDARAALEAMVELALDAANEGLSVEAAIEKARNDDAIVAYQSVFGDGSAQSASMFMQMVGWTVERAMQESTDTAN